MIDADAMIGADAGVATGSARCDTATVCVWAACCPALDSIVGTGGATDTDAGGAAAAAGSSPSRLSGTDTGSGGMPDDADSN